MKDLKDLVRPNVWNMKPYSSARDEFQGNASGILIGIEEDEVFFRKQP